MELVAENGLTVLIQKGCKKELGRGSELAIHDKTVSRNQILVELQEGSREASSLDHDTYFGGLSVKVLGANPICIVHIGKATGRSKGQEIVFLKKGEMDTLFSGDKISLSLSLPMFLTVREGEGRKNTAVSKPKERPGSSAVVPMEGISTKAESSKHLSEDDLLGKWKDRKKGKEHVPCITHDTEHGEALSRRLLADATNEEEAGIAQAVARRQKRAFERRQQQEGNMHDKLTGLVKASEDVPNVENEASKLEDIVVDTENIDPVKEFGFLVEGSEFDQYKKRHKPDSSRWIWPPAEKSPAESRSDEDDENQQEKHSRSSGRRSRGKKRTDEDDEEWRGDDQEEQVAIGSAKKPKAGAKVNLRSHEPSSSKRRDTALKTEVSSSKVKNRREEIEDEVEDEDEADETLGGFIVNDDEEDDLVDDDADDEEDEPSEDEDIDDEMDEAEEDEEDAQHSRSKKKREEKPLCKYGKKCYRKNPDHLAQYRH